MANSDKNILITPNVSAATGTYPNIKFTGANNTPITMRVLDDGTLSFEATAGQLFSISDGLTGSIFSVNDISGIPSIEVLDTSLVKLNQYGGSTVINGSAAIQNSSSVNAKLSVYTGAATVPGLIIKGAVSQTANLQEWQNSAGTANAFIDSNGQYRGSSVGIGGSASNIAYVRFSNASGDPGAITMVIRAVTNQSGDLQQWQNSAGTVVSQVYANGLISSVTGILSGSASFTGVSWNGISNPTGATSIPTLVVKGIVSQTADLQQWQNSNGTVVAKIDPNGSFVLSRSSYASASLGVWAGINTDAVGGLNGIGLIIANYNATSKGIVIVGSASQTANLQEWVNSSGTVLSYVRAGGGIYSLANDDNRLYNLGIGGSSYGISWLYVSPQGAGEKPVVIRGAASQTADLQQWQDSSGGNQASMTSYGKLFSNYLQSNYGILTGNATYTGGYNFISNPSFATSDPTLIIKSVTSQTADLQQWQNSSGSTVSRIDQYGGFVTTVYASLYASYSAGTPLYVNGLSGQTGDLTRWQNSAGTILAKVDANGLISSISGIQTGSASFTGVAWNGISNPTGTTTLPTLIIKGITSQTADLQQWQDSSGTVLNSVGSGGVTTIYPTTSTQSSLTVKTNQSWATAVDPLYSNIAVLQYQTDANVISGNIGGRISFGQRFWSGSSNAFNTGMIGSIKTSGNGSYGGGLTFHTANSSNFILYERMRIDDLGTVTISGFTSAAQGLIIKAASSQTADLQQWQNSSGTALAKVDASGNIYAPSLQSTTASTATLTTNGDTGGLLIATGADANKGLVIKSNSATQSGNLFEIQDSTASVGTYFDRYGRLYVGAINGSAVSIIQATANSVNGGFILTGQTSGNQIQITGTGSGAFVFYGTSSNSSAYGQSGAFNNGLSFQGTARPIKFTNTSSIGIVSQIIGQNSQTGDLLQYQTSAATTLGGVNAAGQIYTGTTSSSVVGSTTIALTSAAYTSATVAVFTYGGTSLVQAGQTITIAGVTGGAYNGTWIVSAATATTFTVLGSGFTNNAGTGGTAKISSQGAFVATTASITPVVVQGAASQTANLQEWQNSNGTAILSISSSGAINFTNGGNINNNGDMLTYGTLNVYTPRISGAMVSVLTGYFGNPGIIVRGWTSQTADLQQWQNSAGTVLASINSAGKFVGDGSLLTGISGLPSQTGNSGKYLTTDGTNASWGTINVNNIVSTSSSSVALTVKGVSSQTADLQQWQNNAGTVLVNVTSEGVLNAPIITNAQTGTTYTFVLSDAGKLVEFSNTSAITVTVPQNSSVAYAIGTQINLLATNTGQVTIVGGTGVTVNATPGLNLRTQWSSATLIKRGTDTWVLVGDISS